MHNISIYLHKIVTVLGYQIGRFNISCGNLDKAFRKDISVLTDSHSLLLKCLLKFTGWRVLISDRPLDLPTIRESP